MNETSDVSGAVEQRGDSPSEHVGGTTRRALLTAAIAGAAALVVDGAVRPGRVDASDGSNLVLGDTNTSTSKTLLDAALTVNDPAFLVQTGGSPDFHSPAIQGTGGWADGVWGTSGGSAGVRGRNEGTGSGVLGTSAGGVGVEAIGSPGIKAVGSATGVFGTTGQPVTVPQSPVGVFGHADGTYATGMWGFAGPGSGSFSTGVYGEADIGVWGYGGWGVFGASDATGTGVYGFSGASVPTAPAHTGVFGYSDSGTGVYAKAATGTALYVNGKAKFSRSGRSTIGSGKSSLAVTLAGVTTSSLVFAVLYSNRSGRYVQAVTPTTGKFTIYLNTTVTSSTYVSWFVVN